MTMALDPPSFAFYPQKYVMATNDEYRTTSAACMMHVGNSRILHFSTFRQDRPSASLPMSGFRITHLAFTGCKCTRYASLYRGCLAINCVANLADVNRYGSLHKPNFAPDWRFLRKFVAAKRSRLGFDLVTLTADSSTEGLHDAARHVFFGPFKLPSRHVTCRDALLCELI
jgi:hypothetical protein